MKKSKVWLILGASTGLGDSAARYLKANQQKVIAIDIDDDGSIAEDVYRVADHYGPLDFIINNSNYHLLSKAVLDINDHIESTMSLLRGLKPYIRRQPPGSIINLPPQLCLINMPGEEAAAKSLQNLDTFLTGLKAELRSLDCGLHFLEPGERLV
ncbi:hypothetical protein AAFN85_31575 [Mucilaginibacter sp. CAU 1740]|uniref:hypothetical protein n=1 Tax=Mucilaginibacter sp. CAU 1740 TaxID=3140365 RepID=UPI00325B4131